MRSLLLRIHSHIRLLTWSRNLILTGVLGVAAALLAFIIGFAPQPDKKVVTEKVHPVNTMVAEPKTLAPELTLFGKVESPSVATLTSAVTAYVQSVPFEEGNWVRRGQTLIVLDDVDAALLVQRREADLADASANYASLLLAARDNETILTHERSLEALAQRKAERHRQLRAQKSISQETLNDVLSEAYQRAISLSRQQGLVDDMQNRLIRSEAQISRAQALFDEALVQLDRTRIRAPFEGRITKVTVSPGELVSPGMPVAELYDNTRLEVRAQIPSKDLVTLQQALQDERQLEGEVIEGEARYLTTLSRLSGEVSTGRSSIDGLFDVSNTNLALGRAVKLSVTLPGINDVLSVPIHAVYGQNRIFIVEDERLVSLSVDRVGELRAPDGGYAVLIQSSQIRPGTRIVTTHLSNAVTGLKVSYQEPVQAVAGR